MRRQRQRAAIGSGEGKRPKRRQYAPVGFGDPPNRKSVDGVHAARRERKQERAYQKWKEQNPEITPTFWSRLMLRLEGLFRWGVPRGRG